MFYIPNLLVNVREYKDKTHPRATKKCIYCTFNISL